MTECIFMICALVHFLVTSIFDDFVKKEWFYSDKWYKKFTYDSWDLLKKEPGFVVVLMIIMLILLAIVGPEGYALITSVFIYKAINYFICYIIIVSVWLGIVK